MSRLLRADFYHMFCKKWLWLCSLSMIVMSVMFVVMQYTAMDYEVFIDRVIFLPMSFYGVAIAALLSLFVGEDFSDGVIRNKIISGAARSSIYLSNLIVSLAGCVVVYLLTIATTLGIGVHLFEINVTTGEIIGFVVLGVFTCMAYGSIYCMISMLALNKSVSVAICMVLAFCMLFLCLRTNQILMQQEVKDGVINPYYVTGVKRVICEFLHDINPSGQAAQLSAMECLNKVRFVIIDLLWMIAAGFAGVWLFGKKDIR